MKALDWLARIGSLIALAMSIYLLVQFNQLDQFVTQEIYAVQKHILSHELRLGEGRHRSVPMGHETTEAGPEETPEPPPSVQPTGSPMLPPSPSPR